MLRRHLLLSLFAQSDPRDFALRLASVYGQTVTDLVYTQTFALVGRLRLGQIREVTAVLDPYLNGEIDPLAKPTASHYSGHLPFASMAGRPARLLIERAAARASGNPLDNEMSDSVFMVCPLLAAADDFDGAARHFGKMESLCRRADGLYRHSPLADVAWGRGNAFPMLGLALTLSRFPSEHPELSRLKRAFTVLAEALHGHQHPSGMWRQVIDEPRAWPEYSCTAMIAAAYVRGISSGWLPEAPFVDSVRRAWRAIEARTGTDGSVDGVCESTGKLPDLEAYLARKAIRGIDPRGGAMGLFLATELMENSPVRL